MEFSINKNEWKFNRADVKNAHKSNFKDDAWMSITIPHDYNGGVDGVHSDIFKGRFDFNNDLDNRLIYKGPGWYRTTLQIDDKHKGKCIFIRFEAVSLRAEVWVNGKEVGSHDGGYTAFEFDITDYIKYGKPNVIAVRSDNSNNPNIAPWMKDETKSFPYSFDYGIYGGIYRDVRITVTDPIKIEKVLNTPVSGAQAPTSVSIDTYVKNYSDKEKTVDLKTIILDPKGNQLSKLKTSKKIKPGQTITYKQSASTFNDVQFWSPESPKLYKVQSEISYDGNTIDNVESTFGVRYFTLANKQAFSLNGNKSFLRGINRHQDMEGLGYALPNEQHIEDAKLIKDAGFNAVRHAHYPADPEFVKACDELGLMLWLEIPLTGSTSDTPKFLENCKSQLTEMIEQNYNNPSVIAWGIGNESDRSSTEEISNTVFKALVDLAHELDPSRPVLGCNYKFKSNQDLVDVYSPQDWSGWYSDTLNAYNPDAIIGEYGASIDYFNHSDQKFDITKNYNPANKQSFWSQEFGCFIHEYKISLGESQKELFPGHFAWVAFDFASPRAGRKNNPIPFMNQKGLILYDHKTKKDIYYLYQSMYREAKDLPMVYIVSESWKDRWKTIESKDVWVYSNCDSVKLFNDYGKKSFGTRIKNSGPRKDTRFQWDSISVENNVLYAEGWYNGKMVTKDTLLLNNLPPK
ncbi:glycoside hydrolase family 2 protein [Flaviramulus basaltis]|uniref:glycoside hydrolase family 2 protein n=1 Tax=Flaviramulus basaltis TaxID=369401 RepID=UPI000930207A|nr:glycoside hydrolase family 2 TIM barrel-domain containing protein [Flaviramulus basaltis]